MTILIVCDVYLNLRPSPFKVLLLVENIAKEKLPPNYYPLGLHWTRTYHKHWEQTELLLNTKDVPDKFYHSTNSRHSRKEY